MTDNNTNKPNENMEKLRESLDEVFEEYKDTVFKRLNTLLATESVNVENMGCGISGLIIFFSFFTMGFGVFFAISLFVYALYNLLQELFLFQIFQKKLHEIQSIISETNINKIHFHSVLLVYQSEYPSLFAHRHFFAATSNLFNS